MSVHGGGAGRWGGRLVVMGSAVALAGLAVGCGTDGGTELSCPDGKLASIGALQNPEAGVDNATDALAFVDVLDEPGGDFGMGEGSVGVGRVVGSWSSEDYTAERATFVFRQEPHGVTARAEVVHTETGWVLAGVTACAVAVGSPTP